MYVTSHNLVLSQKLQKCRGLTWWMSMEHHLFPYLGSRVRHSMGNISDKAPDISILYQSSDPLRNVIQKPHGIAKEVHRPQDPRCLAEEFLSRGGGRQKEEQPLFRLQCPKHRG